MRGYAGIDQVGDGGVPGIVEDEAAGLAADREVLGGTTSGTTREKCR
jgi:hypothetical protein